jgi:hypothetical protein
MVCNVAYLHPNRNPVRDTANQLRKMNERELLLSIIVGLLLFIAGVVDMLNII